MQSWKGEGTKEERGGKVRMAPNSLHVTWPVNPATRLDQGRSIYSGQPDDPEARKYTARAPLPVFKEQRITSRPTNPSFQDRVPRE